MDLTEHRTRPTPWHGDRASTGGRRELLIGALAYLLAFAVTYLAFVYTAAGQRLDGRLLSGTANGPYDHGDGIAEQLLGAMSHPFVIGLALAAVLVLGLVSRRPRAGLLGLGVAAGTVLLAEGLKEVLIRPDIGVTDSSTHNSFPGGHTSAAIGVTLGLLLAAAPRARVWIALPATVAVTFIASGTTMAGWHRISDTIGACLLAAALCCLTALVLCGRGGTSRDAAFTVGHGMFVLATPPLILLAVSALPAEFSTTTLILGTAVTVALTITSVLATLRCVESTATPRIPR
ncbi:phosphatase PAP2 family protein [Sciscionella marina]|uniref:phosphatase PAP2 family protein n=1 Tax=Sciscionella marina TaxID=508770 RepID=UPI000364E8DF|nr:phosphatase PAP2 family protein [Sciscionella marina]